jgi:hypothetical protein
MVRNDAQNESACLTVVAFVFLALLVLGVESCHESRQRRQEAEQQLKIKANQ